MVESVDTWWTPPGLQGDSSGPQSWVNINTLSMEIIQSYNRKVDNPIRSSQNIVDNLQPHTLNEFSFLESPLLPPFCALLLPCLSV